MFMFAPVEFFLTLLYIQPSLRESSMIVARWPLGHFFGLFS